MTTTPLRYLEIKERLIRQIAEMRPHDRLPSRTVLADTFQAARTTIERAISEMIGEGYLYSRDGSGTYVAEAAAAADGEDRAEIKSWGLLIPDIQHYNYPDIARGVGDVASEHEMNLIICNTDDEYEKQTRHIDRMIASKVNGLIIVPAIFGKADLTPFYRLQEAGIPFVFCQRTLVEIAAPRVIANQFFAGYMAARHLIDAGRRKIGFISRPLYSISSDRYMGYLSALNEAGLPVRSGLVAFETAFESEEEGYASAIRMLSGSDKPDAIFCFNDRIARGAYAAASERGIAVGQDLAIVGCDNTDICLSLPVKLTSVHFQTYDMGKLAAETLLNPGNGSMHVLQPEIVIRESSR